MGNEEVTAFVQKLMAREQLAKEFYDKFCEDIPKAVSMPFDYLVTIVVNGDLITEMLEYDGNIGQHIWLHDWYEGQTYVEFVGCVPIRDIRVVGTGENLTVEVWAHEA